MIDFTGERIVPGAANCEPLFAEKMYTEHSARYLLAAQLAVGARVLDVGCGVGYGAQLLARSGAREVIAFDLSAGAIAHAREFYADPVVKFHVRDATDFAFEGTFDLVTCFELIEHVPDQEAVFRCIKAALAPGGVVVMSTPRALDGPRNEFHTHEYTCEEFEAAFGRHFRHQRMMVENNHFTALVADGQPEVLDRIHALHPQFGLDQADYLIGLGTDGEAARLALPRPVMVINNEAYVKRLERDEAILQARRIELDAEVAALRSVLMETEKRLSKAVSIDERVRAALARFKDKSQSLVDQVLTSQKALAQQFSRKDPLPGQQQKTLLGSAKLRTVLRPLGRAIRSRTRRIRGVSESKSLNTGMLHPFQELRPLANPTRLELARGKVIDVIFAIGCWEGESKRYRVHNVVEALIGGGYKVEVIPFSNLACIVNQRLQPKVVVLFRAPDEPWTDRYFSYARANGIKTIFDVDDLVFEPDLVEKVHGYHLLHARQKAKYHDGVRRYRQLMLKCDAVTVTTQPLLAAATALGRSGNIIPNSWNFIQSNIAKSLVAQPRPVRPDILIGYFSGSRTHDRDFQEAAQALTQLMDDRPEIRLRLVGELDPGPEFAVFGDRIERLPFMPYEDMLRCIHECDITIAPLEPNNPFNNAKSELKWFESALVKVPTVVSPSEPFRAAIRHGETGFLAETKCEWYSALLALADDPALRHKVGHAAGDAARAAFGPDIVLDAAKAAYGLQDLAAPVVTRGERQLRIDWIVPGLIIGGGGHRNILRAAHFLEKFGHDVGLVFTNTKQSPEQLRGLLHQHFYPFDGPIRRYDGVFRYTDALFATHWTTVEPALAARGLTREVMYFVQDFEPMFAPMGTEYILAENTYRQGLYSITSGPWCEHLLKREFGAEADHFEFPIDRDVYFPRPRTKGNLNVLYFAKPEMPRRCYELGVMMLRELHRLMPEVEIIFYGSKNVDLGALGFPVTLQGVLPTIHDLAQAYSNADLGIVFSTTNPSLVPYEMMACGTPVVDLGRPGNEVNYGGRFDAALLADPQPAAMARQVRNLLLDPAARAARSKVGLSLVETMPTEEEMARRVETLILQRLARDDC
jgi:SAM-dependent methyltransferase/glycosyltransferase involved in cell wall biosynthesis